MVHFMSECLVINMAVLVGILGTFSWQKNDSLQLENRRIVVKCHNCGSRGTWPTPVGKAIANGKTPAARHHGGSIIFDIQGNERHR